MEADNNDAHLPPHISDEPFLIIIKNLPIYYGISAFKRLINERLKLNSTKMKLTNKSTRTGFAAFANEEDRQKASNRINGYNWKGSILQVITEPGKRNQSIDKLPDRRTTEERVKDAITPLADLPYDDQLKIKYKSMVSMIRSLTIKLWNTNVPLRQWMFEQKLKNKSLICPVDGIKYSTKIDGYRNKFFFSFGTLRETQKPVVGFLMGKHEDGKSDVGPVGNLRTVPKEIKKICEVFEDFINETKLTLDDSVFKHLLLRVAKHQIMMLVGIYAQNLTADELKEFKARLVDYFARGPGCNLGITSIHYRVLNKRNSVDDHLPPEHLWGGTHIYEIFCGLTFKISHGSMIPENLDCAETLYQTVIDLARPTLYTTVLDLSIGNNTIGLCMAKHCGQVLATKNRSEVISEVDANAEANNITNCTFIDCKTEDNLGMVCSNYSLYEDIIAIVDPGCGSLRAKTIYELRNLNKISRIVYLCHRTEKSFADFVDLAGPTSETLPGNPFVPIKAVPVDLFPHTKNCEVIIRFDRYNDSDYY